MTTPTGTYANILTGYLGFLDAQKQAAFWEGYLKKNGLTAVPPETPQDVIKFGQYVAERYQSLAVNENILTPESSTQRQIMFDIFSIALKMMNVIQDTSRVLSQTLVVNAKWQDEYTKQMTRVPLYGPDPSQKITVDPTDLSKTTFGYADISFKDIFESGVGNVTQAVLDNANSTTGSTKPTTFDIPLYKQARVNNPGVNDYNTFALRFSPSGGSIQVQMLMNGVIVPFLGNTTLSVGMPATQPDIISASKTLLTAFLAQSTKQPPSFPFSAALFSVSNANSPRSFGSLDSYNFAQAIDSAARQVYNWQLGIGGTDTPADVALGYDFNSPAGITNDLTDFYIRLRPYGSTQISAELYKWDYATNSKKYVGYIGNPAIVDSPLFPTFGSAGFSPPIGTMPADLAAAIKDVWEHDDGSQHWVESNPNYDFWVNHYGSAIRIEVHQKGHGAIIKAVPPWDQGSNPILISGPTLPFNAAAQSLWDSFYYYNIGSVYSGNFGQEPYQWNPQPSVDMNSLSGAVRDVMNGPDGSSTTIYSNEQPQPFGHPFYSYEIRHTGAAAEIRVRYNQNVNQGVLNTPVATNGYDFTSLSNQVFNTLYANAEAGNGGMDPGNNFMNHIRDIVDNPFHPVEVTYSNAWYPTPAPGHPFYKYIMSFNPNTNQIRVDAYYNENVRTTPMATAIVNISPPPTNQYTFLTQVDYNPYASGLWTTLSNTQAMGIDETKPDGSSPLTIYRSQALLTQLQNLMTLPGDTVISIADQIKNLATITSTTPGVVTAKDTAIPILWRAPGMVDVNQDGKNDLDLNNDGKADPGKSQTELDNTKTAHQQLRGEYNAKLQMYIENTRSLRQRVRDWSTPITNVQSQARESVTQMADLLTAIVESMKGLLSSIFR